MTTENGDSKGMSRKEREREQHRLEILAAAERVFARDGYHGTTVESIAKEAEFAVGTLYNFFAGKDELYGAVMQRIASEVMEEFEREVGATDDPVRAVSAVFDLRVKMLERHGAFVRLLTESAPKSSEELHAKVLNMFRRYMEVLSGVLRRGAETGVFRIEDPLFAAHCLEGVCHGMMTYWMMERPTLPLAEVAGRAKSAFLEQIRRRA